MKKTLFLPLLFLLFTACQMHDVKPCHDRTCIDSKIEQIKAEPVTSPATRVYSYQYNGQKVYHVTAGCCDMMGKVYDENCNFICSPHRGTANSTDPDSEFFTKATHKKLVWEDTRTQ